MGSGPAALRETLIAAFAEKDPEFRKQLVTIEFIQEFQGYISPGILTVFLFGFFIPRSPR